MGVRGLTTFISNNAHLYLAKHELHDCIIIIDGNNISSQLYVWASKSNSAFGGDYDRYYKCVRNFFLLLRDCKVIPLVIFDGGYETRKLGTVWARLRNKFLACSRVNPKNQVRKNVFPLLMREVFRDILIELEISFAQCDFEADEEIATLARELNCPVLSYDSDFLVHNIQYIPFNSFQLSPNQSKHGGYSYIGCELYKVDRFLASFGGLQQEMLPLMATLLGNDYIKRELFDGFFAQIPKPRRKRDLSEQHRRIAGLLQWLRRETVSSAVPKILGHLKQNDRRRVSNQMDRAIASYTLTSSEVRKFLTIPHELPSSSNVESMSEVVTEDTSSEDEESDMHDSLDAEAQEEDAEEPDEAAELDSDDSEKINHLEDLVSDDTADDETPGGIPAWFLNKYRQGLLPACFMDLLTKGRFYILQPQKEDYSLRESAHKVGMPLLRHLVTLILGPEDAKRVKIITRHRYTPSHILLFKDQPSPDTSLPPLVSLPDLKQNEKLELLLKPTGITFSLNTIPEEWRLYFLAVAYWANEAKNLPVSDKHVHAVVLAAILLALVQPFKKEKKNLATELSKTCSEPDGNEPDIKSALATLNTAEYANVYSTIYIPHSHAESRNFKNTYDLSVVHSCAQLQSVALFLTQLNQLLGMPLKHIPMHRLFSGTLLYNIMRALRPRQNIEAYLSACLNKSPSILKVHRALATTVMIHLAPNTTISAVRIKRRGSSRKRKRAELSESSSKEEEESAKKRADDSDSDSQVDPSNRFALLLNMD